MHFNFWKLADFYIIVSLIFLVAAWRWGDWRNWQKYYPTILFFILGNFAYGYITYDHPLWEHESPLFKSTLSDIFITLISFPALVLIFLPHYPNGRYKRIGYILIWVVLSTAFEWIALKLGFFSYHNGWNTWHSVLFNFIMFPLLRLHHTKPLPAWIMAILAAIVICLSFNISLSKLK